MRIVNVIQAHEMLYRANEGSLHSQAIQTQWGADRIFEPEPGRQVRLGKHSQSLLDFFVPFQFRIILEPKSFQTHKPYLVHFFLEY